LFINIGHTIHSKIDVFLSVSGMEKYRVGCIVSYFSPSPAAVVWYGMIYGKMTMMKWE
jgi:hypothetical protein